MSTTPSQLPENDQSGTVSNNSAVTIEQNTLSFPENDIFPFDHDTSTIDERAAPRQHEKVGTVPQVSSAYFGTRPNNDGQNTQGIGSDPFKIPPAELSMRIIPTALSTLTKNETASSNRHPTAQHFEVMRAMHEKQKRLIEELRATSDLAGGRSGFKPGTPLIPPLCSPDGLVTPLALEGSGDYFQCREYSTSPYLAALHPESSKPRGK